MVCSERRNTAADYLTGDRTDYFAALGFAENAQRTLASDSNAGLFAEDGMAPGFRGPASPGC